MCSIKDYDNLTGKIFWTTLIGKAIPLAMRMIGCKSTICSLLIGENLPIMDIILVHWPNFMQILPDVE